MPVTGKNDRRYFTLTRTGARLDLVRRIYAFLDTLHPAVLRLEQKANVLRKTQQDTRFILESIVREARSANGEFSDVLTKRGYRIGHAYEFPDNQHIALVRTDFEAGRVIKKIYGMDAVANPGVVTLEELSKPIDNDVGKNFVSDSVVFLNDIVDINVLIFSLDGSFTQGDINLPPKAHIRIKSESGSGRDSGKSELRAETELVSSATPRSY